MSVYESVCALTPLSTPLSVASSLTQTPRALAPAEEVETASGAAEEEVGEEDAVVHTVAVK